MTDQERTKAIRNAIAMESRVLQREIKLLQDISEEIGGDSEDIGWMILHHTVTRSKINLVDIENKVRRCADGQV